MRVWRERNKKEKMVSSGHQSVGGSELRSDGSPDWIRDQGGAVIRLHFFFRSRSKRGGKEIKSCFRFPLMEGKAGPSHHT